MTSCSISLVPCIVLCRNDVVVGAAFPESEANLPPLRLGRGYVCRRYEVIFTQPLTGPQQTESLEHCRSKVLHSVQQTYSESLSPWALAEHIQHGETAISAAATASDALWYLRPRRPYKDEKLQWQCGEETTGACRSVESPTDCNLSRNWAGVPSSPLIPLSTMSGRTGPDQAVLNLMRRCSSCKLKTSLCF